MKSSGRQLETRLAELRAGFDAAFAVPLVPLTEDWIDLAIVVANGQRYAIQLSQLAGLEAHLKMTPVPAELPGLLGLSAVRGHLVSIFDLATLLGASRSQRDPAPGWVALHPGKELIGLAFDEFEGSRRLPKQALCREETAPGQALANQQVISLESGLVHVVDVPAIISRIGSGKGH